MAYGGTITAILVPDRNGVAANVALGFADAASYEAQPLSGRPYFGALIGRYANRIAGARFSLGGRDYLLSANDGANILHGGWRGFDSQLWKVEPQQASDAAACALLSYISPAGAEGFPGALSVRVHYAVTADNALHITYEATTDAPTVLNLTNHTYFNLAGEGSGSIEGHVIQVCGDLYLPVDSNQIPKGPPENVEGTAFDLRKPLHIGPLLASPDPQIRQVKGFDHSWVLHASQNELRQAAMAHEPSSGRWLECLTTQPAIQFYTGNNLDGTLIGTSGRCYDRHAGFALETQHFPDTPNRPYYPSCVLVPGHTFRQETVFRFGSSEQGT